MRDLHNSFSGVVSSHQKKNDSETPANKFLASPWIRAKFSCLFPLLESNGFYIQLQPNWSPWILKQRHTIQKIPAKPFIIQTDHQKIRFQSHEKKIKARNSIPSIKLTKHNPNDNIWHWSNAEKKAIYTAENLKTNKNCTRIHRKMDSGPIWGTTEA